MPYRRSIIARFAGLLLVIGLVIRPAAGLDAARTQRASEGTRHWPRVSRTVSRASRAPTGASPIATATSSVLISAVYYDGYAANDADEAFQLTNVSPDRVELQGWTIHDNAGAVVFPSGTLGPSDSIWITRSRADFVVSFGFQPDWVMDPTDPLVPALGGSPLRFANSGDGITLWDGAGRLRDAVVYKGGDISMEGWRGPSVKPYTPSPTFAAEGQILYRKTDRATQQPAPDTNTVADWAQDPDDPVDGRRVRYPGWDLDPTFYPAHISATAALTVAVGPDHLFHAVVGQLEQAQHTIEYHGYTLEHPLIAQALAERAQAGVEVTLLLEDGPAGGIAWAGKWAARQIEAAGGRVYLMVNRPSEGIYDRYRSHHPKVFIIDHQLAMVGSENPNLGGMPSDDFSDGTAGHRGVYLMTDAPAVVAGLQAIFDADLNTVQRRDIVRWPLDDPGYAPPDWYEPRDTSGGTIYPVLWPEPFTVDGTFQFELVSSPENSLDTRGGLLGLVSRVGAGDTLYVQQLQEPPYWGPIDGSPATDPNVRLEAFIEAARRGARVRILLDGYFDEPASPRSNAAAVAYVNQIASDEDIDLRALQSNLTGRGIHNKMVLAEVDGAGYVHVGSINGSEAANKINREVALQVQSNAAYRYLAGVFELDWALSAPAVLLPLVANGSP
ncbi:MAG: Cardiolipin synthase B [Anaerolineales bacterium]|nr:Cardiolipin synthase B [Anaerolineales bacterium]